MRWLLTLALLGCKTTPNPLYCDATRPCADSESICDLERHVCVDQVADIDGGGSNVDSPVVLSFSPANNAQAVKPDVSIVVTFSRPMNQASVQAAWTSSDVPAASASFSWSVDGLQLTVTPIAGLPHATGTGLDPANVIAKTVMYSITTDAQDTAGTPLPAQESGQFTTIRRMSHDVGVIDALTQTQANDSTVISPAGASTGDTQFNGTYVRMFVGFMLPSLPVGSDLHKAEFHVPQTGIMGSPYTKFGNLRTQHVNFAAFSTNTYNGTPLANLGDVAADGTAGTRIQDVTAAVESDYLNTASRGSRSQYRLEFPSVNDDGVRDQAYFTRTGFVLRLIYDLE